MAWIVQSLNTTVDAELEALPDDMLGRFWQIADLIKDMGLEGVRGPYVDHLQGPLWEMRLKGRGRDRARDLRYRPRTARRRGARVRQEDPEDTTTRDQARVEAGEGGEMTRVDVLHRKWLKERPGYAKAVAELEAEFQFARELIGARARAGLTQDQLAERMKTTRTVISRLESGRMKPSTRTLERYAQATGHKLKIIFEPDKVRKQRHGLAAR